jgi:hypothetical protein
MEGNGEISMQESRIISSRFRAFLMPALFSSKNTNELIWIGNFKPVYRRSRDYMILSKLFWQNEEKSSAPTLTTRTPIKLLGTFT